MFVCDDCGAVSDDELGFCSRCGSVNGHHAQDTDTEDKMRVDTQYGSVFIDTKDAKRVPVAMLLAFIPGFFDIFGLGQLYLRKYSHALAFMAVSAVLIGVRYFGMLPGLLSYVWIIGLVVFVVQLLDMNRIVSGMFR